METTTSTRLLTVSTRPSGFRTEQVSEAGMNPGDRTLRGKVPGPFFGSKRIWRSSIA
jgi:hypothetical protein